VAAVVALAAGLPARAGCHAGDPPDSAAERHAARLEGAWVVANGTERLGCDDEVTAAPLRRRVWFERTERGHLLRLQDDSLCELRFRVDANGARVVPDQWCESFGLDHEDDAEGQSGGGGLVHRRLVPVTWTIRPLEPRESGLYREAYELRVYEIPAKGPPRECTLIGAATLAPPGSR
jgi:hypothetical protein